MEFCIRFKRPAVIFKEDKSIVFQQIWETFSEVSECFSRDNGLILIVEHLTSYEYFITDRFIIRMPKTEMIKYIFFLNEVITDLRRFFLKCYYLHIVLFTKIRNEFEITIILKYKANVVCA